MLLDSNKSPAYTEADVGELVRSICRKKMGVKLSPNRCRTLVETVSHKLEANGHISKALRESVHNVSGHTSQIAKDEYVLEDRRQDAINAKTMASIFQSGG